MIRPKIAESFEKNPLAWIFFVLFLLAEFWNYQKGVQLDKVCEGFPETTVIHEHPPTPLEEAKNICDGRNDEEPYQPE